MDVNVSRRRGAITITGLMLGYIGVYLCRKNLSVAMPLIRDAFSSSREQIGWIATVGTLAYTAGKLGGAVVDKIGGRAGFLLSLCGVALFGAAGALAPGLLLLTIAYGLNRFFGAFGWGAMMKLAPSWYRAERLATVAAVLSLSYIGGGVAATLLARAVLQRGGGLRAVLLVPSLVLVVLIPLCAALVRRGPLSHQATEAAKDKGVVAAKPRPSPLRLLSDPQFLIVCVMSFTITLLRETFNTWSVDFLATLETGAGQLAGAALKSTSFDVMGGASIFLMGYIYDRVPPPLRRFLICGILLLLAVLLLALHPLVLAYPATGVIWIGLVGLLVYGPYSLLAGVFAVDCGGEDLAASAAGIVDAVGYLAGALAGVLMGRILDRGGYGLGFRFLALVTVVSALLSLGKRSKPTS